MGVYDPGQLYVDPILTNFSVGWKDQQLFGMRVFPETPVNTQSGRYRVFDRSDWIVHKSRREPGTVANEVGARKWSEDTFGTQEHSLQSAIEDEVRQQLNSLGGLANPVFGGDLQIDPEQDAVDYIVRSIMLEHELAVADTLQDTGNYASDHKVTLSGSQKWSDYDFVTPTDPYSIVSDPVGNMKTAFQRINLDTGRWPNTVIFPWDAAGVVENHPRVVNRFKNFALTNPAAWQELMGLPPEAVANLQIIVADSKFNAADNVDVAEDIQRFWDQNVWIGLVDQTPGQKTMTFGKTFAQIYPNGTTKPSDRWREENRKSDIVRTSYKYDLKIVSAAAGYLITNAVAAIT